jgi:hypothetical protein
MEKNTNTQNTKSSFAFSESKAETKTINQLNEIYTILNNNIVITVDKLHYLLNDCQKVSVDDIDELRKLNIDYSIKHFDKKLINQHGIVIVKIILEASMSDAYKKLKIFFTKKNTHNSIILLNHYKTTLLKISEPNAIDQAVDIINMLHACFIDLENDFNMDDPYNQYIREFNFNNILKTVDATEDLYLKKQILINALSNSEMFWVINDKYNHAFDDYDYGFFRSKCNKAIKLIDFQIKNTLDNPFLDNQKNMQVVEHSKFKLAPKKKNDFIKIISAMYDNRMFETEDGYLASSKQELIKEFGRLVNENFDNYSVLLSKSKNPEKSIFLKPFKDLEKKAEEYYDKEY